MKKVNVYKKGLSVKKTVLLLAAGTILVSVFLLSIRVFAGIGDTDIVAYINNEPVTVREYAQALLAKRYDTYAYFKQKYGVDDSASFWTENHGGETPLNKVRKDALDYVVIIKVQQILAREKGIVQDISYGKLLKDLETENARRREALKNNQVIYGPKQYDEKGYCDLTFSNMVDDLKKTLIKEMTFNESEITKYYQENSSGFKKDDTTKVEKIAVKYSDHAAVNKPIAEKEIKDIKAKLENGESFENISKAYGGKSSIKVEVGEQSFGPQTAKSDYIVSKELAEAARKIALDQTSEIMDFNGAFHVIRCIEKTPGTVLSLDEVRENIKGNLFEKEYNKLVSGLVGDVEIVINDKVYGKVGEKYLR